MSGACMTPAKAEKRLIPLQVSSEIRINDIEQTIPRDPARALHLIGMFRSSYNTPHAQPEYGSLDLRARLETLEQEALAALKDLQGKAVSQKRWDLAASYARSLMVLGIPVENTGAEPDFILAEAKQALAAGNNLAAFLGAVRAHALKPLEFEDALLFLERAAAVYQRRTAAFFLAAAGSRGREAAEPLRAYAEGRDSASDMIKGVATVLIDRGWRIERGRSFPDRVLGSAFFVDSSGLLITNYHVISSEVDPSYKGYSRMSIRLGDAASPRIPARVLGWDKALDLALIKTEVTPEYVFSVVDWAVPKVGDTVLAIGSPGGLENTVTAGIVSALGRRFLQIGDVIQIDAAVNHGNSGGPVVDLAGRLAGIVFAGIEQFQGLNFAVPAERLAAALPSMIQGGKAERPWLGLTISETRQGAEIIYVAPNTPAWEQRLPEGAFIVKINDRVISAPQGGLIPAYQDVLFSAMPGELVALETSDGVRRIVMTAARPDLPLAAAAKIDSRERIAAPLIGLILAPSLGGAFSPSFLVKKVVLGSIADEAGLSEDDPVSIRGFHVEEKQGVALMEINVKKRRMGYLEAPMRIQVYLDSPDTL